MPCRISADSATHAEYQTAVWGECLEGDTRPDNRCSITQARKPETSELENGEEANQRILTETKNFANFYRSRDISAAEVARLLSLLPPRRIRHRLQSRTGSHSSSEPLTPTTVSGRSEEHTSELQSHFHLL